jgi:hypothetical protein
MPGIQSEEWCRVPEFVPEVDIPEVDNSVVGGD